MERPLIGIHINAALSYGSKQGGKRLPHNNIGVEVKKISAMGFQHLLEYLNLDTVGIILRTFPPLNLVSGEFVKHHRMWQLRFHFRNGIGKNMDIEIGFGMLQVERKQRPHDFVSIVTTAKSDINQVILVRHVTKIGFRSRKTIVKFLVFR